MEALTAAQTYRVFIDEMASYGFSFARIVDAKNRLVGYEWEQTGQSVSSEPKISAIFNFVRRQSWLQIDLSFHVTQVPVMSEGVNKRIDIFLYSGNVFREFKEDHPKTEAGVQAAASEVKKLLERFQNNFDQLKSEPIWNRDMTLMGKPVSFWAVLPILSGLKFP
jgi:hypothetical protein